MTAQHPMGAHRVTPVLWTHGPGPPVCPGQDSLAASCSPASPSVLLQRRGGKTARVAMDLTVGLTSDNLSWFCIMDGERGHPLGWMLPRWGSPLRRLLSHWMGGTFVSSCAWRMRVG